MERRGFLGLVAGVLAAPVVGKVGAPVIRGVDLASGPDRTALAMITRERRFYLERELNHGFEPGEITRVLEMAYPSGPLFERDPSPFRRLR